MPRLFFALQPPSGLAAELLERAAPLITTLGSRPVPVGNLHATLVFIGNVTDEQVSTLRDAAAQVHSSAGEVSFDALDAWEKPRILCAIASIGSPEAQALAGSLQEVSIAAGFTPDIKPFRAHLTLARKIDLTEAKKFSWPQNFSPGFVVRLEKFALMESRRGEHGSIYSVVDSWPLYDPKRR